MKLKLNGWKKVETQNPKFKKWAKEKDMFRSGNPTIGEAFEKEGKYIAATDDGGYYKVGAIYTVWSDECVKACWSDKSLFKTIQALFNNEVPPQDPDYTT